MKKILTLLLCGVFLLSGCGGADKTLSEEESPELSRLSLSESIAAEISYAEEQAEKAEKTLYEDGSATQHDLTVASDELHGAWLNALNNILELLEANLSESETEALLKEEEEWLAYKTEEVDAAGAEYEGGSMQPMVRSMEAAELTKERVYELAEYAEEPEAPEKEEAAAQEENDYTVSDNASNY